MKILVVDDEEDKCRLYKEELEEEGYDVVTANTGAGGIELFRNENPDLVTWTFGCRKGMRGYRCLGK